MKKLLASFALTTLPVLYLIYTVASLMNWLWFAVGFVIWGAGWILLALSYFNNQAEQIMKTFKSNAQ